MVIWQYVHYGRTSPTTNQNLGSPNYYVNNAFTALLQQMTKQMAKPSINGKSVTLSRKGEA